MTHEEELELKQARIDRRASDDEWKKNLKESLDSVHSKVDHITAVISGTPEKPGLRERIEKVEGVVHTVKWSIKTLAAGIIGVMAALIFGDHRR